VALVKLSDHRLRLGRLAVYVEPIDLWVGVYLADDAIYVCPVPTVVLRWSRTTATGDRTTKP
jgi:hypothetical protein